MLDTIIIGSGPAGLTAALYASRAGLSTTVFEGNIPGGKVSLISEIENWPGEKNIIGADLATQLFEHAFSFGAELINAQITQITQADTGFTLTDAQGKTYDSKTVILALGSKERLLDIPGEDEYTGKGVSYCAVCDGAFFKEQIITVIGGGDSAYEEANYLTRFATQVNLVLRRDVPRASPINLKRIANNPKISVHYNLIPTEILGDGQNISSISFKNRLTDEIISMETRAVFPFIGFLPVSGFIDLPILDQNGFIEANHDMSTAVPGIFVAGDCRNTPLKQIVTAAADGSLAAQSAAQYISHMNGDSN